MAPAPGCLIWKVSGSRAALARALLDKLAGLDARPTLLMGDLNEWRGKSAALKTLGEKFTTGPPRRSFPARYPLLALDRMMTCIQGELLDIATHDSPLARRASDQRGVRVNLLTNALSATDMLLVYGAYRRYRAVLLAAGAVIHEFSPIAKKGRKRDVLHSKVFGIDGRQAIIGSLNFDLRPAFTNTELGLVFEHPALVADITGMIASLSAPDQTYAVSRPQHALHWAVARPGLPAVMLVEPEASRPQRAISWLVGLLPVEAYL